MAFELRRLNKQWTSRLSLHSDDPDEPPTKPPNGSKYSSGWKFGLITGAVSCIVVFALNLGVTIWSTTLPQGGPQEGGSRRILKEGSCSDIRNVNVALHLLINVLSSILLAASNYGMQCLSAPTRADVDKAHSRGKWLDIGIPSIRNLADIPRKRAILWGLLVLSSVPLHLFYNSVVFSSLTAVDYVVVAVNATASSSNSTFSSPFQEVNQTKEFQSSLDYYWGPYAIGAVEDVWDLARSDDLENLTTSQCISVYATAFQTSRQHVILVTDPGKDPKWQGVPSLKADLVFGSDTDESAYDWICRTKFSPGNSNCRGLLPTIKKEADNWAPFYDRVQYCLSKRVDQHCRLNFSPYLVAIVLVSNALKAAVLLYTALRPPEEPLFVLGDAIQSFLSSPDAHSSDSCLASANDIRQKGKRDWTGPREWFPVKRRWAAAITLRRWIMSILIFSVALSVSLYLLIFGIQGLYGPKDFKTLWGLGFGAVTEVALIKFRNETFENNNSRIILSILLANIPQFVFSGLYFQYNSLFTGMLAAKEWSDFGRKRKALRVSSDPKGDQRSRYFLQLPYRWSVPLVLMSILIHWMLSQSIFVVAVDKGTSSDETFGSVSDTTLYSTCGYSPIAIIAVVMTSSALFLAVGGTGLRRFPTAMPVVGSCSLAIAAACHPSSNTPQAEEAFVPLRWGATMSNHGEELGDHDMGHCGFSSEYVEEPRAGVEYS
ncbi:hypothetical protein B0J13DRAFT_139639 [Dactylonectria estremocensis]|uniref:DUF6536 domain-containing protein n=1 Tax=Dactylonectria estremocensis TaxID=1079267 RepID=A0A9P9E2B0_9HYPO|nr:hypothetical protein B0J13DRAFT_139639 [Dactylonectria estremocensis]